METAGSYAVRFDIDEASLFRAYVPIHAVDIDLLLRQLGKAGVIASSSADNTNEDSIFVALDPGSYLLNVRFSAGFDYTAGECESFHFELAIAPTALFDDGPLNCPRDDVPLVVDSNTILQLPVSIGERNNLIKYDFSVSCLRVCVACFGMFLHVLCLRVCAFVFVLFVSCGRALCA